MSKMYDLAKCPILLPWNECYHARFDVIPCTRFFRDLPPRCCLFSISNKSTVFLLVLEQLAFQCDLSELSFTNNAVYDEI